MCINVIVDLGWDALLPEHRQRLLACTNACKSIEDPETTVPELVKACEALLPLAKEGEGSRCYHGVSTIDDDEGRPCLFYSGEPWAKSPDDDDAEGDGASGEPAIKNAEAVLVKTGKAP